MLYDNIICMYYKTLYVSKKNVQFKTNFIFVFNYFQKELIRFNLDKFQLFANLKISYIVLDC